MVDKPKQLPRLNRISKHYDTAHKQIRLWLNTPQKVLPKSVDKLRDIERDLLDICAEIDARCGTPPADILARYNYNETVQLTMRDLIDLIKQVNSQNKKG